MSYTIWDVIGILVLLAVLAGLGRQYEIEKNNDQRRENRLWVRKFAHETVERIDFLFPYDQD